MDNQNPETPPAPVLPVAQNPTPAIPPKPSVELKNNTIVVTKSHTGLYIVLGVVVVLVALIGAAFWYLNNNQKQVVPQSAAVTQQMGKPQPTPEDFNSEINTVNIDNVDTTDIDKDLNKI